MPLRRRSAIRSVPRGVVRANPQPFEFEHAMNNGPRRAPSPPPAPAPPSHHQPSMGLGGALIALNRHRAVERHNDPPDIAPPQRHGFHLPSFGQVTDALANTMRTIMDIPAGLGFFPHLYAAQRDEHAPDAYGDRYASRLDRLDQAFWEQHRDEPDWAELLREVYDEEQPPWLSRHTRLPIYLRSRRKKEPDYSPEYTHGEDKPPPGFTFDFAPPPPDPGPAFIDLVNSPGASSSTAKDTSAEETILVCAKCLDPLYSGSDGVSDQMERAKRRVWTLRCGHMVDGKCFEALIKPAPSDAAEAATDRKGKGKAKAVPMDSAAAYSTKSGKGKGKERAPSNNKGKGKASTDVDGTYPEKAQAIPTGGDEERRSQPRSPPLCDAAYSSPVLPGDETSSIRSRLRPRTSWGSRMLGPSSSSTSDLNPYSTSPSQAVPPAPASRPIKPLPKGRGRQKKETYIWTCPVVGCGRQHTSRGRGDVWEVTSKDGPIALYL
jgi:hypothetical protein